MYNEDFIILGGSGFVGSSIYYYISGLKLKNCFHFVSRSKTNSEIRKPNILFHSGCIVEKLGQIFFDSNENKKFIIINLIGSITNNVEKLKNIEELTYTILSTLNLKNTKKILHISSSAVYGGLSKTIDLKEDNIPFPNNNYGKSKLILENIIKSSSVGEISTILRIGNILGGDNLTKNLNFDCTQTKKLEIYSDGLSAKRTYIDPLNLSKLLIYLGNKKNTKYSLYNCGASKPFFMEEVLKAFKIKYKTQLSKNKDNEYLTLNTNKLSKEVGYDLIFNINEMISNTISVVNKK